MTHEEANAKATRLNREIGTVADSEAYYVAVERSPGEWSVERREQRPGWLSQLIRRLMEAMPR